MIRFTFSQLDRRTHQVTVATRRIARAWRRMVVLQLVGVEALFAPVWRHRRQPFKPAVGKPREQPACLLMAPCPAPHNRSHPTPSN